MLVRYFIQGQAIWEQEALIDEFRPGYEIGCKYSN